MHQASLKTIFCSRSVVTGASLIVTSIIGGYALFIDFIPTILGEYADQRFVLILLMLVFAVGSCSLNLQFPGFKTCIKSLWPFALLIITFLLTALLFAHSDFFLVEPVFYALYFVAFALAGYRISCMKHFDTVISSCIAVISIACFFYAAMTMTVYIFSISDDFSQFSKIIPWGFVNIRYWSHIATWFVPILPLAILTGPLKSNRLWCAGVSFTAAIWWWIIFMSTSRGSMAGIVMGMVLVSAVFGRASKPLVVMTVKWAVLGLLVWVVLSVIIPSIVFDDLHIRSIKSTSSGRMPLWQEAWAMSFQNFPFGMGPQSWLTHEIIADAYRASPKFGHPHNMYLMWAAEYGWVSVLGVVIAGVVASKRLWQRRTEILSGSNSNGLALIAFTASVTAALVHSGVSAVFIAPASMLVGLVVLSIFWALTFPSQLGESSNAVTVGGLRNQIIHYSFVLILVIGGSLWVNQVLKYHNAMQADIPYYQTNISSGNLPRFWFHGNFPRRPEEMP